MSQRDVVAVSVACLGMLAGCGRSGDKPAGKVPLTKKPASASAPAKDAPTGTLMVSGKGTDLYRVFDEAGKTSKGYTGTGVPFTLPPGTYTIVLNNTSKKATVRSGEQTTLQTGSVVVTGAGKDLYEVHDELGKRKLSFKSVNGETELFEGTYLLKLNNSTRTASVRPGQKTTVAAGTLTVAGANKELYEVYDQAGKAKLSFTFTGTPTGLFPGTYTVMYQGKKRSAVVKANQQTTVKPE